MPESHGTEEMYDEEADYPKPGRGPLAGLKVIELAGIGPGPYAAMLLADMGADVIRVDRPGKQGSAVPPERDVLRRNRRSIVLNVGDARGAQVALDLIANADVVIEGFRPGVAERLGLGPEACWSVNPRLVYGRMTGWGQFGPLASSAGHDIGYIAITGALGSIGVTGEAPVPPVNLVGDFGGGSTFLVMGILAACWEARRSGKGQVVDAAIVDGAASLTGLLHGMMANGLWQDSRGVNMLDGGLPWYDSYQTSDGRWMAVGALEPQFFAEFVRILGIDAGEPERRDPEQWPSLRASIALAFASRSADDWTALFEGTDACVAPVLSLREATQHPHLVARGTFVEVGGIVQPAPAPRFSRTEPACPSRPPALGEHTREVLEQRGIADVEGLLSSGIAAQA